MAQHAIRNEAEREALITRLRMRKLPCVVSVVDGGVRSLEQNRLQHLWHSEAAEQLEDETAEDKRAFAKLRIGVPILRENDAFRERYDAVFKGLSYETKIELMKEPFDFPCTRLMTVRQKSRFLNELQRHYLSLGVRLTDPGDLLR